MRLYNKARGNDWEHFVQHLAPHWRATCLVHKLVSVAQVLSFSTTEFHHQTHPAASSSTSSLHLAHSKVNFPSAPLCQSKLTTLYNHKCWLFCPAGFASWDLGLLTEEEQQGLIHPSVLTWLPQLHSGLSRQRTAGFLLHSSSPYLLKRTKTRRETSSVALATRPSPRWAKP